MPDIQPSVLDPEEETLLNGLNDRLKTLGPLAIAFSGGLDSRFLAFTAARAGLAPLLLHVRGPHMDPAETAWAADWAKKQGLRLRILDFDPLDLEAVQQGARDRCYFCKRAMFTRVRENLEAEYVLCDGTNASDLKAWRPGLRALQELGVCSPLALAGLEKSRIRTLAVKTGLDRPGQQARPCLLTRLEYGLSPDPDLLALVARMEACAESAFCRHLPQRPEPPDFRVRVPGETGFMLQVEAGGLSPAEKEPLFLVLKDAFARDGLPIPEIIFAESVSGFFDAAPPPLS